MVFIRWLLPFPWLAGLPGDFSCEVLGDCGLQYWSSVMFGLVMVMCE